VGYPQNLPGFPKCVDQVIDTDPVVGDIDGDGRPEIVHGTGSFYTGVAKAAYAWECDGTAVSGWPVALSGQTQFGSSLALANLDGDAAPKWCCSRLRTSLRDQRQRTVMSGFAAPRTSRQHHQHRQPSWPTAWVAIPPRSIPNTEIAAFAATPSSPKTDHHRASPSNPNGSLTPRWPSTRETAISK
jgi:hypothetical protein